MEFTILSLWLVWSAVAIAAGVFAFCRLVRAILDELCEWWWI